MSDPQAAPDLSLRQRDQALALVAKPFGATDEAAPTSKIDSDTAISDRG